MTVEERELVLGYIAEHPSCSVREAVEETGLRSRTGLRRRDVRALRRTDQEFEEDYQRARGLSPERITSQAVKLAIEGVRRPMVSAGKLVKDDAGEVVYETIYSERLLQTLINGWTPEGKAMAARQLGIEINGNVQVGPVQEGVPLANVARVLLAAGVDLEELAAGEAAGEIVAVDDQPVE